MIRILPFILIPVLVFAGLGFWRYQASKNITTPQSEVSQTDTPLEVPKTLPQGSLEERVKDLESLATKLAAEVNKLKSPAPKESQDPKLNSLDAAVTELKVKVANLQAATPTSVAASSTQATVFIPLGSGGSWDNKDWESKQEYEISLDPSNYPGYTGMNLEATFRMYQKSGTGSVRLYNVTDGVGYPQADTTSDALSLHTSSSFKLPTGTKTYKLQVKSSEGATLAIQSVRLRVSF